MGTVPNMKKMLFALVLGAALAYVFDPKLGTQRRNDLKRKLDRTKNSAQPAVESIDVLVFDERRPAAAGMS